MATVKNREFNIRVSFDTEGNPSLGFVQGFYAAGSNCVDIKGVPDSVKVMIAKKLGIKDSTSFAVKRQVAEHGKASVAALPLVASKQISAK